MIIIFELIIATLGIIISLSVFLWTINRSGKRDMDKKLEMKIDKELVNEKLKLQSQRILTQEIRLTEHQEKIDAKFLEMREDINYIRGKTDSIIELLTKNK